jgi:hypothetical protein
VSRLTTYDVGKAFISLWRAAATAVNPAPPEPLLLNPTIDRGTAYAVPSDPGVVATTPYGRFNVTGTTTDLGGTEMVGGVVRRSTGYTGEFLVAVDVYAPADDFGVTEAVEAALLGDWPDRWGVKAPWTLPVGVQLVWAEPRSYTPGVEVLSNGRRVYRISFGIALTVAGV